MTNEEKKAIEHLKNTSFDPLEYVQDAQSVDIVLKLINKQQKEIEELKEKDNYWKANAIPKNTINYLYVSKDKIRELQQEIHIELDKNAFTRGYQLIIDDKFKKLLEESEMNENN